jgi:hypothetical protein
VPKLSTEISFGRERLQTGFFVFYLALALTAHGCVFEQDVTNDARAADATVADLNFTDLAISDKSHVDMQTPAQLRLLAMC